jgi:hypothetical protein
MKKLGSVLFPLLFLQAAAQPLDSTGGVEEGAPGDQQQVPAIFNGRIFYGYSATQGHAFYPDHEWHKGWVRYEDTWYKDISMKYDIYRDELVLLHPGLQQLRLFSPRVQEFKFDSLHFIRIDKSIDSTIREGFYQRLEAGYITVLASRQKRIEETVGDARVVQHFEPVDFFFLLKDGHYYPVKNLKSILTLAASQRQQIMKHLRQKGLKYRRAREATIVEAVKFYNQSVR